MTEEQIAKVQAWCDGPYYDEVDRDVVERLLEERKRVLAAMRTLREAVSGCAREYLPTGVLGEQLRTAFVEGVGAIAYAEESAP